MSSLIKTRHHIKMFIKSPSFNDTSLDLNYWRDQHELLFNIEVRNFSYLINSLIPHLYILRLIMA